MTAAACCMAVTGAWAQTADTTVAGTPASTTQTVEEDASDFTFTESQLDEDVDAAQTISNVASSNNDPYLSNVGFLWSSMRFKVRALDNMYSTTFLNGLEFNDLELGRYNYSLLGGLNDATRSKEGSSGFENNSFGVTGLGGGENMNLRASHIATGQKVTLTACNRNYKTRMMYTFGTGVLNNGWSFAGTFGYRWADEGVIEGTFYNSFSYLLAVEKRTSDLKHHFALTTFGAPTERAQQGASTEEAYWLANSHYYNPNWGYQNGKKRNSRVVRDYEPTALFTWDWNIDNDSKLSTSAAFKYANYSSSALGWGGEAYDPRPDYYKNLPSSIFNVYDPEKNNGDYLAENPFLMDAYNSLYDMWQEKENRQVNWDRMYYVNQQNGESLYYQERRHNDQRVWALSSTYSRSLNTHNKLMAGILYNNTRGMHYKTMGDLLGGSSFLDVDKFAAGDYGMNSIQAQPDLNHVNRRVKEGDRFGYDYDTDVNLEKLWAQYAYNSGHFSLDLAGHLAATQFNREGNMRNGQGMNLLSKPEDIEAARAAGRLYDYQGRQYYDNSYGASDWAKFLGGGVKGQLAWMPMAGYRFTAAASWEKKAPLVRNAFVAPRVQNNYVDNLTLEDILGAEASVQFAFGLVSGKVTGYYNEFKNAVEQTAFFNDANSAFTYLTMSKVNKRHYGMELALDFKIIENLYLRVIETYGEAEYTNNPYAQLTTEGMSNTDNVKVNYWENPVTKQSMPLRVAAKGMHEGSTPLTALTLGLKYNWNYWFFEFNANYFDRVYLAFSQYRRLTNIMTNYTPSSVGANGQLTYDVSRQELDDNGGVLLNGDGSIHSFEAPTQEKFKGGWMFDASIGKSLRLKHGQMSINLQLQNIANNTNMRTGGYEQNRDDSYYNTYGTGDGSKGQDKAYKFSRNAKYYYANAFNFFLNVNYRF